jgi:hypothetical protein
MTQNHIIQSEFDAVFKAFEQSVSKPRFKPYRKIASGKVEAVALYLWNIALCEALYPSFYGLETALRSATYDTLVSVTGNRFWYDDAFLLGERHQQQVVEARDRIEQKRLSAREPHRIIAELSFGFWVNLYSDPYINSVFIPAAESVFPGAPKAKRMQGVLYPLLHEALDFRNRVFHHEPIHNWPDLIEKHSRVNCLFEWISPVQRSFLRAVDRFPDVQSNGWSAFHDAAWFTFMREEQQLIHPIKLHQNQ